MLRTIITIFILIAAVLWLPLWAQFTLFVLAVLFIRYRVYLLIPAIVADVLYAPTHTLWHLKMTLFVGVLLLIWYIVMQKTRLGIHYVSIQK